ncbi:nucleoside 2-deoxyribosyltransferase [Aquimarina litoralis]|uniref:nucleoside 2-deoxyribosyltransferase n=1 Tax=Aquimarina litoralis TaxID=584605 RepID=UPI001C57D598|nr:nucleoside 2-deoxyribosyltransferase [Aquimarina litoralis]MBW1298126.1 hypothetical protein [Aquimarina litoralis]
MKILVIGGYHEDNETLKKQSIEFTKVLGKEIMDQGHILLNACMTEFDTIIAESASQSLHEEEIDNRIISYIAKGITPSHKIGRIRDSQLENWELGTPSLKIPEPIFYADVVITVCGSEGVQRAANWARIARKPILPIKKFKGASELIYFEEKNNFYQTHNSNINLDEFEDLSQSLIEDQKLAQTVVNLAERIKTSKNAFVIMPFDENSELENTFDSFEITCSQFTPEYNCIRMDKITDIKRITPEMFSNIKKSAFVIVDLTLERPNVYYELGYADALNKPIIATAKKGTSIHFNAKDIPILFWDSQKKLREELFQRINQIAINQGR